MSKVLKTFARLEEFPGIGQVLGQITMEQAHPEADILPVITVQIWSDSGYIAMRRMEPNEENSDPWDTAEQVLLSLNLEEIASDIVIKTAAYEEGAPLTIH